MRILRAALAVSLLGIALAGCTMAPTPPPDPTTSPTATGRGEESDAIGLVGLWRVSGAEDESADTWLRLDAGEGQLWRDCGMAGISWVAQTGLFLAGSAGWTGCMDEASIPTIGWLERVTGYERDGDGWKLLAADGAALATLTVDGAPEPSPNAAEFYTQAPAVTGETHEYFRDPVGLASFLTTGDLEGRWLPEDFTGQTEPFVEFNLDTWSASDGCNQQSGRWVSDPTGLILTTSGITSLVACDGVAVGSWVALARSAGFDGETLVLANADGIELGRLVQG